MRCVVGLVSEMTSVMLGAFPVVEPTDYFLQKLGLVATNCLYGLLEVISKVPPFIWHLGIHYVLPHWHSAGNIGRAFVMLQLYCFCSVESCDCETVKQLENKFHVLSLYVRKFQGLRRQCWGKSYKLISLSLVKLCRCV